MTYKTVFRDLLRVMHRSHRSARISYDSLKQSSSSTHQIFRQGLAELDDYFCIALLEQGRHLFGCGERTLVHFRSLLFGGCTGVEMPLEDSSTSGHRFLGSDPSPPISSEMR
jgi:hypothetical protein